MIIRPIDFQQRGCLRSPNLDTPSLVILGSSSSGSRRLGCIQLFSGRHIATSNHVWQGRGKECGQKGCEPVHQGWPAVSCRENCSVPQEGQVCHQDRCWSPSLPSEPALQFVVAWALRLDCIAGCVWDARAAVLATAHSKLCHTSLF